MLCPYGKAEFWPSFGCSDCSPGLWLFKGGILLLEIYGILGYVALHSFTKNVSYATFNAVPRLILYSFFTISSASLILTHETPFIRWLSHIWLVPGSWMPVGCLNEVSAGVQYLFFILGFFIDASIIAVISLIGRTMTRHFNSLRIQEEELKAMSHRMEEIQTILQKFIAATQNPPDLRRGQTGSPQPFAQNEPKSRTNVFESLTLSQIRKPKLSPDGFISQPMNESELIDRILAASEMKESEAGYYVSLLSEYFSLEEAMSRIILKYRSGVVNGLWYPWITSFRSLFRDLSSIICVLWLIYLPKILFGAFTIATARWDFLQKNFGDPSFSDPAHSWFGKNKTQETVFRVFVVFLASAAAESLHICNDKSILLLGYNNVSIWFPIIRHFSLSVLPLTLLATSPWVQKVDVAIILGMVLYISAVQTNDFRTFSLLDFADVVQSVTGMTILFLKSGHPLWYAEDIAESRYNHEWIEAAGGVGYLIFWAIIAVLLWFELGRVIGYRYFIAFSHRNYPNFDKLAKVRRWIIYGIYWGYLYLCNKFEPRYSFDLVNDALIHSTGDSDDTHSFGDTYFIRVMRFGIAKLIDGKLVDLLYPETITFIFRFSIYVVQETRRNSAEEIYQPLDRKNEPLKRWLHGNNHNLTNWPKLPEEIWYNEIIADLPIKTKLLRNENSGAPENVTARALANRLNNPVMVRFIIQRIEAQRRIIALATILKSPGPFEYSEVTATEMLFALYFIICCIPRPVLFNVYMCFLGLSQENISIQEEIDRLEFKTKLSLEKVVRQTIHDETDSKTALTEVISQYFNEVKEFRNLAQLEQNKIKQLSALQTGVLETFALDQKVKLTKTGQTNFTTPNSLAALQRDIQRTTNPLDVEFLIQNFDVLKQPLSPTAENFEEYDEWADISPPMADAQETLKPVPTRADTPPVSPPQPKSRKKDINPLEDNGDDFSHLVDKALGI